MNETGLSGEALSMWRGDSCSTPRSTSNHEDVHQVQ